MKLRKLFLAVALTTLSASVIGVGQTSALTNNGGALYCFFSSQETFVTDNCDLKIDKQVAVNSGTSTEAPTASQAVTASVGDTLTWTVTVSNNSPEGYFPAGEVAVTEAVPSNVHFVSATPSTGTYNDGTWTFGATGNLPATLVVVTTTATTGTIENTASLTEYNPCPEVFPVCIDPPYSDTDSTNNTANAFVNIPAPVVAKPVVKAPNTGFGIGSSDVWAGVTIGTLVGATALAASYKLRRLTR
ncbi:MAG: DUF11 domain-containing protein [Candidatus Saccharimonadales bacterium]